MRFTRLRVEGFRGIESADLSLGPSLNVLYGPNDLGKSTLATALRAALLAPTTSSETESFVPWHRDVSTQVELTFQDASEHLWRVTKRFGAKTGAELAHSKDGVTFTNDAKGRNVDESVRKLLSWGIALPGGKGAPRGIPESFLSRVLLAEQGEADEILRSSIADDRDESGKLRLTRALAALAEDPMFKRVLDAAQLEVDRHFSSSGKTKRALSSPLAQAATEVKEWRSRLAELDQRLAQSSLTEERVAALQKRRAACLEAHDEARTQFATVEARAARTALRDAAVARAKEADAALAMIEAHQEQTRHQATREVQLEAEVTKAEAALLAAAKRCEDARQAVTSAQETRNNALVAGGATACELRASQRDQALSSCDARAKELAERKKQLVATVSLRDDLTSAQAGRRSVVKQLDGARSLAAGAQQKLAVATSALVASRLIVAYARWKAAADAAEMANKLGAECADLRTMASQREAHAVALEAPSTPRLPGKETLGVLQQLHRDVELAESALGGGLTLSLRPREALAITITVDGKKRKKKEEVTAPQPLQVDAARSVSLAIDDLLELDVQAGAPEKRLAAQELRARWTAEATPILAAANAADLADLAALCATADESRARAGQRRAEAVGLREKALAMEARAAELSRDALDLRALEEPLEGADRAALELSFAALGSVRKSEGAQREKEAAIETVREAGTLAEANLAKCTARLAETDAEIARLAAALSEKQGADDAVDLEVGLREVESEIEAISASRARHQAAFDSENAAALAGLTAADARLAAASKTLSAAEADATTSARQAAVAQSTFHDARGRADILKSQLGDMDRAAAEAWVTQRRGELAELPADPPATEADMVIARAACSRAEAELAEAKTDLDNAEGALQGAGGASLREDRREAEEALERAVAAEAAVERGARAWRLLHETLREVEKEEGSHLGRSLAGPVAERFADLTASRYRGVELDAMLRATGVGGTGQPGEVLAALSVGTRDQLATLLRITIAEQLGSAIVLDDHLVHTDPARLAWFRAALRRAAVTIQVIVLTCRPEDYLDPEELPATESSRDLAGGAVRAVNLEKVISRWPADPG